MSNLRRFKDSYDWRGLMFLFIALNETDVFKWKNKESLNVLELSVEKI